MDSLRVAITFDDDTVGGDFFSGFDKNAVARFQRVGFTSVTWPPSGPYGLSGHELDEELQFLEAAGDGSHFDPVAQQHDEDEGIQFPKEVHAFRPKTVAAL